MLRNRNKRPSEEDSPGPKAKNKRDGTMKVAGRLVQVDLENFMCHGNLRVNFDVENHNCLYIGGPNGSGKSALFAAINIGLGGAGRGNERGNSVQMYIKTGKSRAKTRITLTNTGEGSFEDYDRIIVERTILEAGGSYSIKGVRGGAESLIPGGKTTLNKIISRYGIELNNPIYWLSQDRARKFLADTNPKQLFQIFADASELDTTLANYNEIGTHMHAINGNLTNLTRILAGLREDYRKKQAIMTRRQKEIALIGEIQILHWFSQFSPLRDIEEAETELKRRIEENKAAHRKLKQKHKDEAVELAQWREELENLAAKTSEKRGEVDDLERQLADYEDQMVPYNEELKDLERKIQRANQDIEQSDATIRDAKRKIRQEKEKLAKNQDRHQMEELQVKVTELEKLEAANRDEIQKIEHKMETMKPAVREAHTAAFEASNQAQQQRVEHQQLTREIGSIQERSKNNLSRFGPTIPQVVQKINEQAARFSVKPKGPMGSYIQVRDKKYQLAVEQALRRQLGTFIFANRKDELLFIRMMEHYGIHCPPTTVVKFGQEPHSTSDNEPPGRVATVLRMIDVTDNDVRNTLIDATGMECIALFDSDQEAREIMNGSAPQNCNTAYTCSGAEVHGKSARGGTQYRFYACHQRHATILADSSNANIEDLTRQLEVAKRQYDMANETARNKNSRSDQLKRQYELLKRQKDDLEDKLRRYESQKTRIRREIATIVDREDGNVVIGVQQRLLGEVEESKAQLLRKRDQLEDEKRKKQRKLAKMEGHRKAFQQNASDHAQEMDETESVAEGLKLKIQQLSGKIQESEAQMRQLEEKVRKWTEEDAVSIERRKDEALAKLNEEEVNPPPNYPDRPDFRDIPETRELLSMMKKRESELNGVREALGEAPTEEHLKQIKDKFEAGRKDYVALRNINEMLQKTLILRKKKFPVFRHGIISRVKDAFQDLIRYKFEGEMLINTEQRTININIKPHSSNPKEKLKDIRGLSGGEKSYTTTCFLMALWTIMETPFRCMDEFDVFMDGHMRKTAMDLIVAEATRKYKHQQFIFFTPQGINEIKKDNTDNQVATFEMPKVRE